MSRVRLTIASRLAVPHLHAACLAAINRSEWIVAGIADTRITCQELLDESFCALSPVRVAIVLVPIRPGVTEATLHGATFGNDPLESAHLRKCVSHLAAAVNREIGDSALRPIDRALELMARPFDHPREMPSHVSRVAVAG